MSVCVCECVCRKMTFSSGNYAIICIAMSGERQTVATSRLCALVWVCGVFSGMKDADVYPPPTTRIESLAGVVYFHC